VFEIEENVLMGWKSDCFVSRKVVSTILAEVTRIYATIEVARRALAQKFIVLWTTSPFAKLLLVSRQWSSVLVVIRQQ